MKMFCAPTDKTEERCQKTAECGLLAVLAPFVSGGAGIFEISTDGHFRIRRQFVLANAIATLSEEFSLLLRRFRGGEFLEVRISPQRVEHRVEPEQPGCERHARSKCAIIRHREHFL